MVYDQYYPSGFPDEVRYSSDNLDDAIYQTLTSDIFFNYD